MKMYSLIAGLALCAGVVNTANAKIVRGTVENYFAKVYATDVTGATRMAEFDEACRTKHWFLVNTPFFVDYRVNTDSNVHAAFMTYANVETQMNGVFNTTGAAAGKYVFTTTNVPASLKDMKAKSMVFTVNHDFWGNTAQIIFEGGEATPAKHTDGHDCHHVASAYQCVVSTH